MLQKELEELLVNNKWDEAILHIETIDRRLNDEELSTLAWCYSRSGKYDKAIELYDEMISREPQKAKWYYAKGYQFYMQQIWQTAIDNFTLALSIYENYFIVKYRIAYAYIQMSGNVLQWSKDSFWKAIRHLEDCHKIFSSYTPEEQANAASTYADICALHGKTIMTSERYLDKSIDLLNKALELKVDDDFKYQLAKAYYAKKQYSEALDALPISNKPYYVAELRGQILSDSGEYERSNSILLALIKFRKKDYLFRRISDNFLKIGNIDKAEEFANKAIQFKRRNYKNHYALGVVLKEKMMYRSAISSLENARKYKQDEYSMDCIEAIQLIDEINALSNNNPIDIVAAHESKASDISVGKIIKYNANKGYGFILDFSTTQNLFFHISSFSSGEVKIGQKVSYEIIKTEKGEQAINVSYIR